jgi:hypothetical protein
MLNQKSNARNCSKPNSPRKPISAVDAREIVFQPRDRATYFARCWPNSKGIESFDFINLVSDGDRVIVTYGSHNTNREGFRNTEIVAVRDGQIVEVEVYFGWSVPHKAKSGGFISDNLDRNETSH